MNQTRLSHTSILQKNTLNLPTNRQINLYAMSVTTIQFHWFESSNLLSMSLVLPQEGRVLFLWWPLQDHCRFDAWSEAIDICMSSLSTAHFPFQVSNTSMLCINISQEGRTFCGSWEGLCVILHCGIVMIFNMAAKRDKVILHKRQMSFFAVCTFLLLS